MEMRIRKWRFVQWQAVVFVFVAVASPVHCCSGALLAVAGGVNCCWSQSTLLPLLWWLAELLLSYGFGWYRRRHQKAVRDMLADSVAVARTTSLWWLPYASGNWISSSLVLLLLLLMVSGQSVNSSRWDTDRTCQRLVRQQPAVPRWLPMLLHPQDYTQK